LLRHNKLLCPGQR